MARTITIRVDFFQAIMPSGVTQTLQALMERACALRGEARNRDHNGMPVRLQTLNRDGIYEGDLMRIKLTDLPPRAKLNGDTADLDLEDDEGLGEETAFLYSPELNVLALQRNGTGVTRRGFISYFSEIGQVPPFDLVPVVSSAALTQLARQGIHRKLTFKIARVSGMRELADADLDENYALDILDRLQGGSLEITVSMGRLHGSLVHQPLMDIVRALYRKWRRGNRALSNLEVYGKTDDNEKLAPIDLLEFAVHEQRSLSYRRSRSRTVAYTLRRRAVREAWEARKAEISQILSAE